MNNLFRQEVLDSKKNTNYGVVFINIPPRYKVITLGFSTLVLFIVLFVIFGEFSEKFIVKGYLNSPKGVVKLYPSRNGTIVTCYKKQGDSIRKGESLFLIDTAYKGADKNSSNEMLTQLEHRKKLIDDEIIYKKTLLTSLKKLLINHYLSAIAYHEKQQELTALENNKNLIAMEIIKQKQDNSYLIRSPIDGVISSLIFNEGQYTNQSKPLAKIVPSNSNLVAELYIPVGQSGFLNKSNRIIIRYDAYPYERFGTAKGVISEISKSILTDDEEEKPLVIGKPYYKVIAALDKQFITVYGEKKTIQHGMTISAVVIGTRRKIWQWVLDPLYSYYGELFV